MSHPRRIYPSKRIEDMNADEFRRYYGEQPLVHTRPALAVGILVNRAGKILLGKRISEHQGGMYSCPGGHVELWESLEEAAARELEEECGKELRFKNIRFIDIMNTPYKEEGKHFFVAMFVVDWISGEPSNMEPEKCAGWEWHDWCQMPRPLIQGVEKLYQKYGPEAL
jgi:8-oxo-dGTP diphosphatase